MTTDTPETQETLDDFLKRECPEGDVAWAKRALSSAYRILLQDQARNAAKLDLANERGLDPAYKDLYDLVLPHGFVLGAKTYGEETVYRLTGPQNLVQQVEATEYAKSLGIVIESKTMQDGNTRYVADLKATQRAISALLIKSDIDYKTMRVTPKAMREVTVMPRNEAVS